jgi:hypothetical protein
MNTDSPKDKMTLLEIFQSRNLEAAAELCAGGLKLDVSEIGKFDLTSKCSVNIESDYLLGNLAMWSSGECDLLVTDEKAEQVLVNESNIIKTEGELRGFLDNVYDVLRGLNHRAI